MCPYIQHVWNSCSGNPAAVCLLEEDVPDQLKQAHYQTVIVWSFWILKLWWWWRQKKWRVLLTGVSYWDEYFWNMLPHSSSWGNKRSSVASAMFFLVFFIVLGISAHPLLDFLLISAHPMSLTTIFSRLRGRIPLWPQMVHPNQWSEQHREQKERQARETTVQMSDFIQSMLYMSHEASVTIGVGLCQVNPIRICQKSYSWWLA